MSYDEAKKFADQNHIDFFETSAKTGHGVEATFTQLTQTIYDKILEGDYRLQDGWDGIKKGYFGGNRYQYGSGGSSTAGSNVAGGPHNSRTANNGGLLVAEAARDRLVCCYTC